MSGKYSIQRAKDKLIAKGICAIDGSGDADVECLFQRVDIVRSMLEDLIKVIASNDNITRGNIRDILNYI